MNMRRQIVCVMMMAIGLTNAAPVSHAAREPGDTCDDAILIDTLPYSDIGSTGLYEDDYDAVCPYENSISPDIVYMFTPDQNIMITAGLCGDSTDFDTKLYIFENDCISGPLVTCNDDFCRTASMAWTYVSIVQEISLTAGNTYYIVVDGNRWARGTYELMVEESSGDPMLPDPEW